MLPEHRHETLVLFTKKLANNKKMSRNVIHAYRIIVVRRVSLQYWPEMSMIINKDLYKPIKIIQGLTC